MIKTYFIVGLICIPTIECFNFYEKPKPIIYTDLQKCLTIGKKLGDDMFDQMNKIGVPSQIKVWCKELNRHGEYS